MNTLGSTDGTKTTLYRGFPQTKTYAWSPFVTKLEFRLRYADIEYDILEGSTSDGPSRKVPCIDIAPLASKSSGERELVGDSSIIVQTLTRLGALEDLNQELSAEQRLADLAIRGLCKEKLYFLGMKEKWLDNYYVLRDKILASKPWLLRVIIGNMIHRKVVQTLHLQGLGRLSPADQQATRHEIWHAIEDVLTVSRRTSQKGKARSGRTPFCYFGGEDATEVDAVLFAFINSFLIFELSPESGKFVRALSAVMGYAELIHEHYFSDYEKWVA